MSRYFLCLIQQQQLIVTLDLSSMGARMRRFSSSAGTPCTWHRKWWYHIVCHSHTVILNVSGRPAVWEIWVRLWFRKMQKSSHFSRGASEISLLSFFRLPVDKNRKEERWCQTTLLNLPAYFWCLLFGLCRYKNTIPITWCSVCLSAFTTVKTGPSLFYFCPPPLLQFCFLLGLLPCSLKAVCFLVHEVAEQAAKSIWDNGSTELSAGDNNELFQER